MNIDFVPAFLSPAGYEAAMAVFSRRNRHTDRPAPEDFERARDVIFNQSWNDYDRVYVALYTLRLTCAKWLPNPNVPHPRTNSNSLDFEVHFTLDLEVAPNYGRERLLDEWVVADLMSFYHAFVKVVPFQSSITFVGFGCFMISFLLSGGSQDVPLSGSLPAARAALIETFNLYLDTSSFAQIKQRYRVSRMEVGTSRPYGLTAASTMSGLR